jgi:hypothetical protein
MNKTLQERHYVAVGSIVRICTLPHLEQLDATVDMNSSNRFGLG